MKRFKKIFSVLLSVLITFSMAAVSVQTAYADTTITDDNGVVYSVQSPYEAYVYGYTGTSSVVTIPERLGSRTITAVASNAFYDNTVVKTLELPRTILTIGDMAFMNCSSLSEIKIQTTLQKIGQYSFFGTTALKTIDLNSSIDSIPSSAFQKSGIESIIIPSLVKTIGEDAFHSCAKLTSVSIPSTVEKIEQRAFYGCCALESISFSKDSKLTSLPVKAFKNCTSLKTAQLPENLTSVSDNCFDGCTNLERVYISKKCSSFGSDIFINNDKAVIYGYANTPAKDYADSNQIPFVDVDTINRATLQSAVDEAKSIISANSISSSYTTVSLTNLKNANKAAETALLNMVLNQDEIDLAQAVLCNAIDSLVPVTTEPITTEPVTTEPITTEPVTTAPITTEPITTAPTTAPTQPTTSATEPTTDVTEPTTGTTEPTADVTEPTTGTTEPTTDVTEPTTGTTQPSTDVTEPTTEATEPSTDVTEPTTEATEPTSSVATDDEPSDYLYGDADGDGKINIKDATQIQRSVAGIITLSDVQAVCADVNLDGKVNIVDVTNIQRFAANYEVPNVGSKIPLSKLPK